MTLQKLLLGIILVNAFITTADACEDFIESQSEILDVKPQPVKERTIELFDLSSSAPDLIDDEQIIKFIEENAEQININLAIDEYFKQTVLFPSCQRRRKMLVDYLIRKNCDVKHQDQFGFSSLMTSAEKNYSEIMLSLISVRHDIVEDQDEDGLTALSYAARTDSRDALLILINVGADVRDALKDKQVTPGTKKFIRKTRRNYLWLHIRKIFFKFWSTLTWSRQIDTDSIDRA